MLKIVSHLSKKSEQLNSLRHLGLKTQAVVTSGNHVTITVAGPASAKQAEAAAKARRIGAETSWN